jgi:adiponectin receptor
MTISPPQARRKRKTTTSMSMPSSPQLTKIISSTTHLLSHITDIQPWQHDNEYLHTCYRVPSNSYKSSLSSLFYLHNQTGNIYTHLLGALLFTLAGFHVFATITTRYATADAYDLLAFGVFLGSAIFCFGVSATFHVFGNHSSRVYHAWLMLDLYGIFVLIAGTVFSGTYYGFYCEKKWWVVYSVGVSIRCAQLGL